MARFCTGPVVTSLSKSATVMIVSLVFLPSRSCIASLLPYSVTQPLGCRHPDIVALKIHAQDVIVCGRRVHLDRRYVPIGIAHRHFRLAGVECRAVDGPIGAVVIGKTLVGGEPGAIAVHAFDLVQKIAGEAAILGEEIVPAAAVVAARAEISGDPDNLVDIADRGCDLVDETLILEEHK